MPDIYLYAGETNPSDIRLSDPTIITGGSFFGILKVWTGSVWAIKVLKVYISSWVTKPVKRWTGTEWMSVGTLIVYH